VMTPPLATALTTAAEVQLAGVPCPITRVGWLVFTARPAGGTGTWPFGLPAAGSSCESVWVVAVLPACGLLAVALLAAALAAVAAGLSAAELVVARSLDAATDVTGGCAAVAHAARAMPVVRAVMATAAPRMIRMGPDGSAASAYHTVVFALITRMFDKSPQ